MGEWGTICGYYYWDLRDAAVVCRELGYVFAVRTLYRSEVPDGIGRRWLRNVYCSGYERSLADCANSGWGSYCSHYDDVGVECSSTGKHML